MMFLKNNRLCLIVLLVLTTCIVYAQKDDCILNKKGVLILVEKVTDRFKQSEINKSDMLFLTTPIRYNVSTVFDSLFYHENVFPAIMNKEFKTLNVLSDSNNSLYTDFIDTLISKPFVYINDSLKVFEMKVDVFYKNVKMSKLEYIDLHKSSATSSNLSYSDYKKSNMIDVIEILYVIPLR